MAAARRLATAAIQDMKTKNRHDLRDGFVLGTVSCHTRSGKRRDERNQEKIISIFFGVHSMRRDSTIAREVSRLQVGAVIIGRFSPGSN
jgi:hypothetical protein